MNILIVGGGLLGRRIAETLDSLGHDVAVIDENEGNLAQLSPDFQGVTAQGFPMDMDSLRAAGIEGCDAVAVTTADDNLNITVGQMAKDVFGISRVVARISDPARESIFQSAGLQTVCPTNMAGANLVSALVSPWQSRQVGFGNTTVALSPQPVPRHLQGRDTSYLELAPGDGLLGVIKPDGRLVLKGAEELPLDEGDLVVYTQVID